VIPSTAFSPVRYWLVLIDQVASVDHAPWGCFERLTYRVASVDHAPWGCFERFTYSVRVVIYVLDISGGLVVVVVVAAHADDETNEEGDGVEDVAETGNDRNAEQERTGQHHTLSERRVVHDGLTR